MSKEKKPIPKPAAINKYDRDGMKTRINALDKIYESLGMYDQMRNVDPQLQEAAMKEYQKNANEVMHDTQTNYGKELVPRDVLKNELIDMINEESKLLSFLPGDHGRDMEISEKVSMIGEAPYMSGREKWTDAPTAHVSPSDKIMTDEFTIPQADLIVKSGIDSTLLNYSIIDLEAKFKEKMSIGAVKTIEGMILNCDTETGGTGNVNSDDQAPATTFGSTKYHSLLLDNGLRKIALSDPAYNKDLGTLERADFVAMENVLGNLFDESCLWIINQRTYNTMTALSDFSDASKRGADSTINGNAIGNIDGADIYKSKELFLTESDGKMSATPASNTKGQILLLYRPAVQYGWGKAFNLEAADVIGKGLLLAGTMNFGFKVIQTKAGMTDSSIAMGRNITV